MTAPRSAAARIAGLERKVAEQQEQIRALSGQLAALGELKSEVAGLTGAIMAAFRYAGVHYPRPRHLRAVPGSQGHEDQGGEGGAIAAVRHQNGPRAAIRREED